MIELPADAVPNGGTPGLIDFGGFLRPPTGARVQRVDRMGNRFRFAFSFPPMPATDLGRKLVSRLIRGKTEGVRMELPLLGFQPGVTGSPVVNGNGQAGRSLVVRGFTPNYAVREGQWFSHHFTDGSCLYNSDGQAIADAVGDATIAFSPMLRVEPIDGDVLNFARPMIEGFVAGEDWRWEMAVSRNLGIDFEIEEYQ